MVDGNEKGHCRTCSPLSHLPVSKDRTSEAQKFVTTFAHIGLEVGAHYYGLRNWNALNLKIS